LPTWLDWIVPARLDCWLGSIEPKNPSSRAKNRKN
jgi:hypothetical protein